MFVPPEERRSWFPPEPDDAPSKRGEGVWLILIGLFLLSMLLAPMGGSSLVQAVLALWPR